jgi:hypothetical protein
LTALYILLDIILVGLIRMFSMALYILLDNLFLSSLIRFVTNMPRCYFYVVFWRTVHIVGHNSCWSNSYVFYGTVHFLWHCTYCWIIYFLAVLFVHLEVRGVPGDQFVSKFLVIFNMIDGLEISWRCSVSVLVSWQKVKLPGLSSLVPV